MPAKELVYNNILQFNVLLKVNIAVMIFVLEPVFKISPLEHTNSRKIHSVLMSAYQEKSMLNN